MTPCALVWCWMNCHLQVPCPNGRFGSTTGLQLANCSGSCLDGYTCPEGSISSRAVPCPIGSYCREGTQHPCPAGRYGTEEHLSTATSCHLCPAGRYSQDTGTSSVATCQLCPPGRSSRAGAVVCWPALVAVTVRDLPPIVAGVSPGDLVSLTFDTPTNRPDLPDAAAVARFAVFSTPVGNWSASWVSEQELLLALEAVNPALDVVTASVDQLRVMIAAGTNLRDSLELSQVRWACEVMCCGCMCVCRGGGGAWRVTRSCCCAVGMFHDLCVVWRVPCGQPYEPPAIPVITTGSWGAAGIPLITRITAYDTGLQPGPGPGDTLVVDFSMDTNGHLLTGDVSPSGLLTCAGVNALFDISASFGTNCSARFVAGGTCAFVVRTLHCAVLGCFDLVFVLFWLLFCVLWWRCLWQVDVLLAACRRAPLTQRDERGRHENWAASVLCAALGTAAFP